MGKQTKKEVSELPCCGIVTFGDWVQTADGVVQAAWSTDWQVITDKQFPVEGFRSAERWQLIGRNINGSVRIIVPGCHVKGFVYAPMCPQHKNVLDVSKL